MKPEKKTGLFGFGRAKGPTEEEQKQAKREKIAATQKEISMQILKRKKYCDQLKTTIDKAAAERTDLKKNAMAALEKGDELEAQMLCTLIKIKNIAIERNTKMYMLNLKISELLGQKQIFLETFDMGSDFEIGNDLIDNTEIEKITHDLKELDVNIELWSQSLDSISQTSSNEVFDELVNELKRKQGLGEIDGMMTDIESGKTTVSNNTTGFSI